MRFNARAGQRIDGSVQWQPGRAPSMQCGTHLAECAGVFRAIRAHHARHGEVVLGQGELLLPPQAQAEPVVGVVIVRRARNTLGKRIDSLGIAGSVEECPRTRLERCTRVGLF